MIEDPCLCAKCNIKLSPVVECVSGDVISLVMLCVFDVLSNGSCVLCWKVSEVCENGMCVDLVIRLIL